MLPGDVALWDRFLSKHGQYFDRFDYDVHVGIGVRAPGGLETAQVQAISSLTQKRIDAVGYRDDEVWIFEVKPDAGLSALGQLVGYRWLWQREREVPGRLYTAVVTDNVNEDEKFLFAREGIRVYIV